MYLVNTDMYQYLEKEKQRKEALDSFVQQLNVFWL